MTDDNLDALAIMEEFHRRFSEIEKVCNDMKRGPQQIFANRILRILNPEDFA